MEAHHLRAIKELSPLLTEVDASTPNTSSSSSSGSSSSSSSSGSSSSSSSSSSRRCGVLILGSGSSASMPQMSHVLLFANPAHPFHQFAKGQQPLPPLHELQRIAVAYKYHQQQQQQQQEGQQQQETQGDAARESSCSSEGGAQPHCTAATAAEATAAEAAAAAAAALEGPALEQAARGARSVACITCLLGLLHARSPNRRRNISLVLYVDGKKLLIDCGKTIRDSLLTFACNHELSSIDGLFLTHDHMDAVGGLDDLRDLQPFKRQSLPLPQTAAAAAAAAAATAAAADREGHQWYVPGKWIRCFLGSRTFVSVSRTYSYIVKPYVERCRLTAAAAAETAAATTAATTAAAAEAAAEAAAAAAGEFIVKASDDGEVALTNEGRLLLKRKIACIEFHILNDTVMPPAAPPLAAPAAAPAAAADVAASAAAGAADVAAAAAGASEVAAETAAAATAAAAAREEALLQQLPAETRAGLQGSRGEGPRCSLQFASVDSVGFSQITLDGVQTPILSFPMYHGGSYVCLGLAVLGAEPLLLLSDVTAVPPSVLQRLLALPKPEVLVLDALGETPHAAHFSVQEALNLAVLLQPRRLLLVGVDCSLEYEATNNRLHAWLIAHRRRYRELRGEDSRIQEVKLAHDGLFVCCNTSAAAAAAAAAVERGQNCGVQTPQQQLSC